jgi:Sec-independent protein translocase protein TatA
VLFGSARLPKLARSLREARHEFQKGHDETEKEAGAPPQAPVAPQATTPPQPASPPVSAPTPPVETPPAAE